MRKFRIKVVEKAGGEKEFFPQWKSIFFWHYFDYEYFPRESFYTERDAEEFIERQRREVVIKTYIKE